MHFARMMEHLNHSGIFTIGQTAIRPKDTIRYIISCCKIKCVETFNVSVMKRSYLNNGNNTQRQRFVSLKHCFLGKSGAASKFSVKFSKLFLDMFINACYGVLLTKRKKNKKTRIW